MSYTFGNRYTPILTVYSEVHNWHNWNGIYSQVHTSVIIRPNDMNAFFPTKHYSDSNQVKKIKTGRDTIWFTFRTLRKR